jgi:hypothetical protein
MRVSGSSAATGGKYGLQRRNGRIELQRDPVCDGEFALQGLRDLVVRALLA